MTSYKKRKMNACVFGLYFFVILAFCGANDRDAKLRFYFDSFNNFTEFSISEAHKIFLTSWYKPQHGTVIFAHGFTGKPTGPAITEVITTYLDQGESNVVLLNWDYLASAPTSSLVNSYFNWAAPNARQLGVDLVDAFISLADAGLNLNETHLIGHSLGAHIWGIAGSNMMSKGIVLPRITGLDPAAAGFEKKRTQKLDTSSAAFVDIIHTDFSKYGMRTSTGTVDFWPNFKMGPAVKQPGCPHHPTPMFSRDDLCSHNRSWQLLVDAIKYPGALIGSYARNYRTWKNYSKAEREAVTLHLGKYDKNLHPGNYYLVTRSESPYGLGRDGL
ncbi:phospholipase A1-like [Vanessa tameamea]|uniref:Phospholipase A1-like n=1 Tax=Vanessa tameamea TaxID=334116 RepID=A0A8B8HG72_VANTA